MGNKVNGISGPISEYKFGLVCRSFGLVDPELGQFVRSNGVYSSDLNRWKDQMKLALESETEMTANARRQHRQELDRLRKALNEANAIIEAQKKILNLLKSEGKSIPKKLEAESSKKSSKQKNPARGKVKSAKA